MNKEGMVAVVRGTKDSGLCVTLLDGHGKYTLLPNTVTQPIHTNNQSSQSGLTQYAVDTSAQAVDGRYASIYQTVHCNMVPTSPTPGVSEFPPQKAALNKGYGNFEVGGLGSGETNFSPIRVKDSYRGGLTWPERGSVFSPRPSVEPDPFANSLRKYPTMSPERSTEMVERLINYVQIKNSKAQRLQNLRLESSSRSRRIQEADIRTDESPTRERSRKCYEETPLTDSCERSRRFDEGSAPRVRELENLDPMSTNDRCRRYEDGERKFERNYDVRNVKDYTRRGRDVAGNSYTQPVCPTIRERLALLLPEENKVKISIDTQVEIPMSSKGVETQPKTHPPVRTVAIPMSPLPSILAIPFETQTSKSIQTIIIQEIALLSRKSVQTCFSSIDITNDKIRSGRRSKSQEELRDNELNDEVLELAQDLQNPEERGSLRDDLLKKLKKIYKADKSDKLKIKFSRCLRDQLFSNMDMKFFTRELSNQLLSKMKKNSALNCNPTSLYRAEVQPHRVTNDDKCLDDIIIEWLQDIPIKNRDYSEKSFKKYHLLTIANKIKSAAMSKLKLESDKSLKKEIVQLIENIPMAVCGYDKRLYVNRLVTDLVKRVNETLSGRSSTDHDNIINVAIASKSSKDKEEDIKYCVREELAHFVHKYQLKICTESMDELELELADIALNAMDAIQIGREDELKEEILGALFDLLNIPEHQANYFANNMILSMKKTFSDYPKSKTKTVLIHDTQRDKNLEVSSVSENDIKANINWYIDQIIKQINEWISSINELKTNNNFNTVVIQDLASDIVDRHKYLQLNPATKVSKADEIEHLKYQIFKCINKLIADDNLETIEKAPELMEKIQSVDIPLLIKPQSTTVRHCRMDCDNRKTNINAQYGKGKGISTLTVAIGSVPQTKASPSGTEGTRMVTTLSQSLKESQCCATLPEHSNKPKTPRSLSDPTDKKQPERSTLNETPSCCNKKPCCEKVCAGQMTQEQIIEDFDQFLNDWVKRIPISEKPELVEKCRLGICNGVWKAISKIKMNPEALDNPFFYRDVLDDEIEELLDCLTQTPELKKQRNGLKVELLEKAANIHMHVAPDALNTSYKQQLVENISNNLPRTGNRVEHTTQDANKLFEDVMKLHLAEYFILYTKYKEGDPVKANVFKRKLLKEVHELVDQVKLTHGKELREIEVKQYVEGVIHALQNVPVPTDETVNIETDEIILALEVEQWFSDLPLMPNEERMDVLSRRKYRDMLAKKLFDLENSNEVQNEEQMKKEITTFLKRMPFIPGETQNMHFMAEELIIRIKSRPKQADDNGKKGIAFVEPHGYEAFSRDMPLCSSYAEDQNGSSYLIVRGEKVPDTSIAHEGQYVQRRGGPDSPQERLSIKQSNASGVMQSSQQAAGSCCGKPKNIQSSPLKEHRNSQDPQQSASHMTLGGGRTAGTAMTFDGQNVQGKDDPDSQQEWLHLEQTTAPGINASSKGPGTCCRRSTCAQSTSPASKTFSPQAEPSQQEWVSLENSAAPGAMISSLQGTAGSVSSRAVPSQQEWQSLQNSSIPGSMRTSAEGASPCCGRPTCTSNFSPASRSVSPQAASIRQNWQSLDHDADPRARNSSRGADPCCGRPTCTSNTSPVSRTESPQVAPSRQNWQSLDHDADPGARIYSRGADPCCRRPTCTSNTSPVSRSESPQVAPSRQNWQSLDHGADPGARISSRGASPCCGRPTCTSNTSPVSKSESLQVAPSRQNWQSSNCGADPRARINSLGDASQQQWQSLEPSKIPSDLQQECADSANHRSQVSTPSQTHNLPIMDTTEREINASREQSSYGERFRTQSPYASVSNQQSKTADVLRGQSQSGKLSKAYSSIGEHDQPHIATVSRGSPKIEEVGSSGSDEELRPKPPKMKSKKTKLPRKVECECYSRTPDSDKKLRNRTEIPSKIPEAARAGAYGPSDDSPVEFSGRPTGYSTPQDGVPRPPDMVNMGRDKKTYRDIEQERREAARRRIDIIEMEDTDDSDRDDVRCKCMERVWRWRRRGQCRPCDENSEMNYMYPFPMYPPPPYFYGNI